MKEAKNYQVGALLYCPANNKTLAKSVVSNRFGNKYSIAMCLEDTIVDSKVREAELDMIDTLDKIYEAKSSGKDFYLPKIFIRIREASQIVRLLKELGERKDIIAGFNIPKFNLENRQSYMEAMTNASNIKPYIQFMPILESSDLANPCKRLEFLDKIYHYIKSMEENILNVRVGGNDLCHIYGLRRHSTETIYDVKPVADALSDILGVFLPEFVVSGPVFEYYNGEGWDKALSYECHKDIIAGFVGKTAIHPKQIQIINNELAVLREDYEDAKQILNWDDSSSYVKGNSTNSRMNEVKTHLNWAKKTMILAEYYGIK